MSRSGETLAMSSKEEQEEEEEEEEDKEEGVDEEEQGEDTIKVGGEDGDVEEAKTNDSTEMECR